MRFSIVSALALCLTLSSAAPAAPESTPPAPEITFKGKCNGTSCKIAGINYNCNYGKCVGNGGGDGAYCHGEGVITMDVFCPVDCNDAGCL